MTVMTDKSKLALDSGGTLKMPGETNSDFAQVVSDYLQNFKSYHIKKTHRQELYEWSAQYLGQKYKDWFIYEGGTRDKVWVINIRSPKKATLFELRWTELIVKTIDRNKK